MCGREFVLADRRTAWGEERVYFLDDAGELRRMPAQWTSLAAADAFVSISAGRSSLRMQDLLQMVALVEQIRGVQGSKKPKRARR